MTESEKPLYDSSKMEYRYLGNSGLRVSVLSFGVMMHDKVDNLKEIVKNVRAVDKVLRDRKYKTSTTFETEEFYQEVKNKFSDDQRRGLAELKNFRRTAKFNFWMESGKIKLSTIQSICKGFNITIAEFFSTFQ